MTDKLFQEILCSVEDSDGTGRDYIIDYVSEELGIPVHEVSAAIDVLVADKKLIEAHPDSVFHGGLYNPQYTPNTAKNVQEENERILAGEKPDGWEQHQQYLAIEAKIKSDPKYVNDDGTPK